MNGVSFSCYATSYQTVLSVFPLELESDFPNALTHPPRPTKQAKISFSGDPYIELVLDGLKTHMGMILIESLPRY